MHVDCDVNVNVLEKQLTELADKYLAKYNLKAEIFVNVVGDSFINFDVDTFSKDDGVVFCVFSDITYTNGIDEEIYPAVIQHLCDSFVFPKDKSTNV